MRVLCAHVRKLHHYQKTRTQALSNKKKRLPEGNLSMERKTRLELATPLYGAENETRTRDPNLGKVVLYQLSYFRKIFKFSLKELPS